MPIDLEELELWAAPRSDHAPEVVAALRKCKEALERYGNKANWTGDGNHDVEFWPDNPADFALREPSEARR